MGYLSSRLFRNTDFIMSRIAKIATFMFEGYIIYNVEI